jgi:hypothetical protein
MGSNIRAAVHGDKFAMIKSNATYNEIRILQKLNLHPHKHPTIIGYIDNNIQFAEEGKTTVIVLLPSNALV